MPAEPTWTVHQHGRHISTPPPPSELFVPTEARIRTPPVARQVSTPPPQYDYFTQTDPRIRNSPPLNPWNPYLRSYGRMYPYGIGVSQYDMTPRNYVMRENAPSQRPLANYQSPFRFMPTFREINPLGIGPIEMRREAAPVRPRSNRPSHHYRPREMSTDSESTSGYLGLHVIEISSDEEELQRPLAPEFSRRPDSNGTRLSLSRNHANKENILAHSRPENASSSPSHCTAPVEVKPNIHPHIRSASTDDSISSMPSHYQADETLALNLSNRMKRPHRYSPHVSSKHYRVCNEFHDTNSQSADEMEQARRKPNVNVIDNNVIPTSSSTSQPTDHDDRNHIERKFKIRIKREFKTEAKCKSESVDSEFVADTKEHLQPLIAENNIKQE